MAQYRIPAVALTAVREAARRIRSLEAEALAALRERDDTAGHRADLLEKCRLLAALPETVKRSLPQAASPDTTAFAAGLSDFAHRADTALSLGSIFFMGALLYPEDYQEGDPNDLERFLERFEAL